MDSVNSYDYLYKIVIIGDSGVGKTQFIERYARNTFNYESKSTIGVEFSTKIIPLDGKQIKLQLWDTAGQERYRAITTAYYRGAVGVIICFDITKRVTFDNIVKETGWYNEAITNNPDTKFILVSTKNDLSYIRDDNKDDIAKFIEKTGIEYIETSSLNNKGVTEAINNLCSQIYYEKTINDKKINALDTIVEKKQQISLIDTNIKELVNKSCC